MDYPARKKVHKRKLAFFCRICGEAFIDGKKIRCKKDKAEKFVIEYYESGFQSDNEDDHPDQVCQTCFSKLKWWSEQKKKFDKHRKRNEEKNLHFELKSGLPETLEKGNLKCVPGEDCKVCSLEVDNPDPNSNVEPSPSKYQKLTVNPVISPSDALKKSNPSQLTGTKGRKSILIEKTESESQKEGEKEKIKIYVSDYVFDINQFVDMDLALIFACSICWRNAIRQSERDLGVHSYQKP